MVYKSSVLTGGGGSSGSGGSGFPFIGPTFAILGDSITANNGVNNPGSGGTVSNQNIGYATWWNILNGQRIYLPPTSNFGHSGDTLTEIAVRVPNVIAANPNVCIVLGGTNDLLTVGMIFTTMMNNMLAILRPLLVAGIITVVIPILPRSGLTAAQQQLRTTFNNWLRELGLGRTDVLTAANFPTGENIVVSDPCPYLENFTAGGPITSLFQDGLHPNQLGAYYMGLQLHHDISPFIPPRPTSIVEYNDYYDSSNNLSGNLYFNGTTNYGLCQGTGGFLVTNSGITPTGSVATGGQIYMLFTSSSMTLVGAKDNPRSDGPMNGERQIITANSTNSGGSNEVAVFGPVNNVGNLATNDIIYGECTYMIDASVPLNITAVELLLVDGGNVPQNFIGAAYTSNYAGGYLFGHTGTIRTPLATILSTSPNVQCTLRAHFDSTVGATGYNGKIYIGDFQIKKAVQY